MIVFYLVVASEIGSLRNDDHNGSAFFKTSSPLFGPAQFVNKLFTVLYFSVRSSRSSALRYGLPSCMNSRDGKKRYI